MNFINNIPPLVLTLIGLLIGAFATRLLSGKDRTLIRQLSTDLAVSEEKLRQLQSREAEFKQLQQLFIETKTENAQLQTRMDEQAKNTAEKLKLLLDAELRL
ncbi:MAG: DNA recombination protein RmuC, partial [Methylobacter sp.]